MSRRASKSPSPSKAGIQQQQKKKEEKNASSSFNTSTSLLKRYQSLMEGQEKLAGNVVQSALFMALSIITSALLDGKPIDWDAVKTMTIISVVFITPVLFFFLSYLNDKETLKAHGDFSRLYIDQFVFSPLFNTGIQVLRLLIEGKTPLADIPSSLVALMPSIWLAGWAFWIPTRLLVIKLVPSSYHMLVGNLCAYVWNIIQSRLAAK